MKRLSSKVDRVVDGHVHFRGFQRLAHFLEIRRHVGADAMNMACILGPDNGEGNGRALYAKAVECGAFYAFGGLNHATYRSKGKVEAPPFPQQVDAMLAVGFEGVKLIEGKPSVRRDWYPFAMDGDYFREFFAHCERIDAPVLWHVADPEEMWDPVLAPKMTSQRDWIYGPEDVSKEQLHAEVDNVLARCPKLRVMLAHFYFLSADLERAGKFLRDHPNAHFDLALGAVLLYNLSEDTARSREFFIEFQDRIVYGTDISDQNAFSLALTKADGIRRFLETDETFRYGKSERPVRGMSLPADVLRKIYAGNFERLAGKQPKPVAAAKAIEYLRACAELTGKWTDRPPAETEPGKIAEAFARLGKGDGDSVPKGG